VAQTVNGALHWSAWGSGTAGSFSTFTVSIARPGVPTMTLTSQSASGRIQVELNDNGATSTELFETQVSNNGTTWVNLRTAEGNGYSAPSGGTATEFDYEAPMASTRYFRTRGIHIYPGFVFAASAWSATQTSSWTSTLWWVKPLNDPTLSRTVTVRSQPTSTRVARQGIFQPVGAQNPIAVIDKRAAPSGQIVFRFTSDSDRNAFEAIADDSSVVLIQAPAGVIDWPDRYVALGDYERERAQDTSVGTYTFDSFTWTEVERPA
jgi:hypothetical protein